MPASTAWSVATRLRPSLVDYGEDWFDCWASDPFPNAGDASIGFNLDKNDGGAEGDALRPMVGLLELAEQRSGPDLGYFHALFPVKKFAQQLARSLQEGPSCVVLSFATLERYAVIL